MSPELFFVILIGGFLRFYKLDWGEGYFFHPDERNIAVLAASIMPPFNFNFFIKGTYAYGSLVSYLAFGVDFFRRAFLSTIFPQNSFTFILLFLRMISAILSTLTILIVYLVGKKFWSKRAGLMSAVLIAFSPGLIQSAHFGTFEAILSFLYLLVLFFNIRLYQEKKIKDFFFSILIIAIASAMKINSLIFIPLSALVLFISLRKKYRLVINILVAITGLLIFTFLVFLLSPYYLTKNFRGMFNYEQQVVRGTLDVFYTKQFIATKPIVFQFLKILPFLTNPLTVFFLPLFILCFIFYFIKKSFKGNGNELIVLCFLGALFLPNAFLFAKWTRYMVPTIPFVILFIAVFIEKFFQKWRKPIFTGLILTTILWGLAFMSIYFHRDTRLTASEWIYQNLENNSCFLNETANVVDIPLPPYGKAPQKSFTNIGFDFYGLDANEALFSDLISHLEKSDYILIPSRRLFGGMGQLPQKYPKVSRYYQLLFSEELGFKEIKRFTSFPRIGFIEFPDEFAEETWSVFDHPVIRIYKKVEPFSRDTYEKLLKI